MGLPREWVGGHREFPNPVKPWIPKDIFADGIGQAMLVAENAELDDRANVTGNRSRRVGHGNPTSEGGGRPVRWASTA